MNVTPCMRVLSERESSGWRRQNRYLLLSTPPRVYTQANKSLSGDGYYYTTTKDIMDGWKSSNKCSGGMTVYNNPYSGTDKLWCEGYQSCSGGDVVRCSWNGWCTREHVVTFTWSLFFYFTVLHFDRHSFFDWEGFWYRY